MQQPLLVSEIDSRQSPPRINCLTISKRSSGLGYGVCPPTSRLHRVPSAGWHEESPARPLGQPAHRLAPLDQKRRRRNSGSRHMMSSGSQDGHGSMINVHLPHLTSHTQAPPLTKGDEAHDCGERTITGCPSRITLPLWIKAIFCINRPTLDAGYITNLYFCAPSSLLAWKLSSRGTLDSDANCPLR
jgi:hypothetical protein